jgi:hypothetical protein
LELFRFQKRTTPSTSEGEEKAERRRESSLDL